MAASDFGIASVDLGEWDSIRTFQEGAAADSSEEDIWVHLPALLPLDNLYYLPKASGVWLVAVAVEIVPAVAVGWAVQVAEVDLVLEGICSSLAEE